MVAYGVLSTFPPTRCSLATHSLVLAQHLHDPRAGEHCGVVHIVDRLRPRPLRDPTVFLVKGRPLSAVRAIEALNRYDVAIVQHDFGIYGGADGEEVLGVVEALDTPVVAVLHAVPAEGAGRRHLVLQRLIDAAAAVIVLCQSDAVTLRTHYHVDADRLSVIPRGGAGAAIPGQPSRRRAEPGPPTILTWGLIRPGKGIEHAVTALARLREIEPAPRYLICGQQDPRVGPREADAYRDLLMRTAHDGGVADLVTFDPVYRAPGALAALAARRPVVATDFAHARELLDVGAGLVVPHRDPEALARALRRVLTEPELAKSMQVKGGQVAAQHSWRSVATK